MGDPPVSIGPARASFVKNPTGGAHVNVLDIFPKNTKADQFKTRALAKINPERYLGEPRNFEQSKFSGCIFSPYTGNKLTQVLL